MNNTRTPLYAYPSMKENYKELYIALVLTLNGNKIANQSIHTIKFKDFKLTKSYIKDGKLCWIVEKEEDKYDR